MNSPVRGAFTALVHSANSTGVQATGLPGLRGLSTVGGGPVDWHLFGPGFVQFLPAYAGGDCSEAVIRRDR